MAISVGHYPFGNTYLDIPEFVSLWNLRLRFNECHSPKRRKAYYGAFVVSLDYMIDYDNLNIGGINCEMASSHEQTHTLIASFSFAISVFTP